MPGASKPFVKWVGGKGRLLDELIARLPSRGFDRYFEPFLGGGALYFAIQPKVATLGDTNSHLMCAYHVVRDEPKELLKLLDIHAQAHRYSDHYYYKLRERWNAGEFEDKPIAQAAAFIYFNKTCFNGLWRVNQKGKMNSPIGHYVSPAIYDEPRIITASAALQNARLLAVDYRTALLGASKGDFIYIDSPYVPVSATANFTAYTADGFSEQDQFELADCARALAARGAYVMLSNSDTPIVHEMYVGFNIEVVECNRAINSKASGRGAVNEVIIRNYA